MLPEGRTVEQLGHDVVTKALAERGYSVVDEKSPEFSNALPLHVEIHKFWSWGTVIPTVSLEFEGILVLRGEALIGSEGQRVRGYARSEFGSGSRTTWGDWQKTTHSAIVDLTENVKAKIRRLD